MKVKKNQLIKLFMLFALFSATFASVQKASASVNSVEDCENLPDEVSTLMSEWNQAGVKTDCTVNQVMMWAVNHAPAKGNAGAITTEAIKLLNAIGYQNAQNIQTYKQATFDTWRKKPNGVSTAFAGWKGSNATVIYLADKKEYTLIQYRPYPKNETSEFSMKITYGEDSVFTDKEKQAIEEAASWWREKIGDKFQIELEFHKDPSLKAGGTTLVGNVPRSCMDHQPGYAEIKLSAVNTSLVSHEIGHALGIGTAAVFSKDNVCSRLTQVAKDIDSLTVRNARMEKGKFFGEKSEGILMMIDEDGDFGHVSAELTDENGEHSAVQPSLGGKPSVIDFNILADLGYEIK